MHKIIAHRGRWGEDVKNQNTEGAVFEALRLGFGVELDLRMSSLGELGTGHDVYQRFDFHQFNKWHVTLNAKSYYLALHVKEKGMVNEIFSMLHSVIRTGVPLDYLIFGIEEEEYDEYVARFGADKIAYELYARDTDKLLEKACTGDHKTIWLAEIDRNWFTDEEFQRLEASGKELILVTPEVVRSDCGKWSERVLSLMTDVFVQGVCTDLPLFFADYEKKFN